MTYDKPEPMGAVDLKLAAQEGVEEGVSDIVRFTFLGVAILAAYYLIPRKVMSRVQTQTRRFFS